MSSAFARFWQTDITRELFLDYATRDELCNLRLVSYDFADTVAIRLFKTLKVCFKTNSFARRTHMLALDRIGHHVKTFHFYMPHSEDTFLPPLLDPDTLEELTVQYEPSYHASRPSSSSSSDSTCCKYGSWEMNDLLVRQYPPLFHAATNITSFIRALNTLPFLRSIRISCPDQPASQRYRRSIVDYALISLRMAIETTNSTWLETLVLDEIHPASTFYLRPHNGLGTSPTSTRVWHRIKNLTIKMDNLCSADDAEESTTDQVNILHTYLKNFRGLERLDFAWLGDKGPSPLSLCTSNSTTPSSSRPDSGDFSSSSSTTSSRRSTRRRSIEFPRLKSIQLNNVLLECAAVSSFIINHRTSLDSFAWPQCSLRSGTWEEALAPLDRLASNPRWREPISRSSSYRSTVEIMDVPIVYSPVEEISDPMECVTGPLWSLNDKDMQKTMKMLGAYMYEAPSRSKKDAFACNLKRLLRGVKIGWHGYKDGFIR